MSDKLDFAAHADASTARRARGSSPPANNKVMPRSQDEWTVTRTMRLPHKVGLPLGSGGGGDDGGGGA